MNTPLTKTESAFAEEQHDLVTTYLKIKGYSVSEFYDIAIFGYLRAVRTYLNRADLRDAYDFRAIAFRCMRTELSNHFRKEKRRKNIAEMIPFEESEITLDGDSVFDSVVKNYTAETVREKLPEFFTERQSNIIHLKAAGYTNREVSQHCGFGETTVQREITNVRNIIKINAPELYELMAA